MRISLGLALILVVFSSQALAAKGGKKKAEPTGPVQTMDAGDPVDKEVSEHSGDAPKQKKKTDEEIEREQSDREFRIDAAQLKKTRARDQVAVFGNVVVGFGKAPEPGPAANRLTGNTTAATFIVGGHYDVSPDFTLGLLVPFTVGSERQIDGLYKTGEALGSPQLMGEYRVRMSPFTRMPFFFGLGIPVAQGDYDTVEHSRVRHLNDFGDAASGYRDPELFAPKRLPITLGLGVDYQRRALSLHAANKIVFGVKVGGRAPQNDPFGAFELKSVSIRNLTSAGIAYQLLDKPQLYAALDSWLAISAIDPMEFESFDHANKPSRFQVVFEPRVGARFGKISPSLGYIFPIGGRLADARVSGVELHCDVAF